ncbi:tyrosine-type recombinase/integrase [Actinospica sp.]|uniref:tyrosine-type recombinase/integrase n=1 Tax=Actinospica sp. TaxID=1872142 RepID=UPI002BB82B0C|nr:tyrosine-type recombinase/integrase [Actinospica sp.]HWG26252.1 tyrosine-type recombinase/integrase [Actinospica sp.]
MTDLQPTKATVPAPYDPVATDRLAEATTAWLAAKKPTTRDAYRRDLQSWAAFCDRRGQHPLLARKPDADLFGAWLQDPAGPRLSATSAARRMAAVSSWYRYLVACDLHERNPFSAAERPRVDRDYSATAFLDEPSAKRLIRAAENHRGVTGLRDAAMIRLMLQLGIRVTEVCALTTDSLGTTGGQRTVTIHGKGGKRVVRALPPSAGEALDRYLAARDAARHTPTETATVHTTVPAQPTPELTEIPAPGPRPLFTTDSGRPVDRTHLFKLVRRLAREADLPHPDSITPHSLRHTFATLATERGADLDDLQDAMGHADPRTTRRYQRSARRLDRDPAHLVAAALG